ncbi:MAG: MmgE/PrpD family protein [Chloroflexota bacterium]
MRAFICWFPTRPCRGTTAIITPAVEYETKEANMGVTDELARFIVESSFDGMPTQATETAKRAILDCFGVTLAGAATPEGAIMRTFVDEVGGHPKSTVIGSGTRTSPPWAAFANGTMGHAEDFDDSAYPMLGHPRIPVLPAVLALGEPRRGAGRDVLEAYIVGFEVESKLGRALIPSGHYQRGWHATGTLGTMGAAAASAKMLGLDRQQTKMALGIAASQVSGIRQNFGTMTKPFHAGHAARSGVVAAMLAEKGFTAHDSIIEEQLGFCNVFKGDTPYNPSDITSGLGETFEIVDSGIAFKLYPSCHETHDAINSALELRRQYALRPDDMKSVDYTVSELIQTVAFYTEPTTGLQGKFSIEYCIARALHDGRVALDDFTNGKVNEPDVRQTMKKIRRHLDPSIRGLSGTEMVIKLTDGREVRYRSSEILKGFPQQPLSPEELQAKYSNCARLVLPAEHVERSLRLLESLDRVEDITELMELAGTRPA